MGQVNLGNMLIGTGYGANISGNSQTTSSTTSSESFDRTFDRTKVSLKTQESSNSTKSTAEKNESRQNVKQNEKTYENKEVKETDTIQVASKSDTASNEIDEVNKEGSEENDESKITEIEDQILILVSQAMNISIDEVKETLTQLGLEAKDLMGQEGFSTFIGEICGQGDVAEFLMNTGDLKNITTLFENLSTLDQSAQVVNKQNTVQQILVESLQQEGMMEVSSKKRVKIENQSHSILAIQTEETDLTRLNEEMTVSGVKSTDGDDENVEASDQSLNFLKGQEQQNEETGINVQVHNFTTTTFIQSFETDADTVTQMATTKSTLSGEVFIEQIDFKVLGQTRELNVQLSPKELGDLNIKIIENNGVLVAEIKVDNDKAKEFILNEIHLLKENLEEQGLNVVDVRVDIRQDNHQSHMEQERQKSSKRIQDIISKHFAESEEEKEEVTPIVGESEIDYMV